MRNSIITLVVIVLFGTSCKQVTEPHKQVDLMVYHQPKRISLIEDSLFFGSRPFVLDTLTVEVIIESMLKSPDTLELCIGDSIIFKRKAEERSDGLVLQRKDLTKVVEVDCNNYPHETYSKYKVYKSLEMKPFNFKINNRNYLTFDVPKDYHSVRIVFFGSVVHVKYDY